MSKTTPAASNLTSTLRKRASKGPREPPKAVVSDSLEDVVLYKMDSLLYRLEQTLDDMEEYGLEKVDQVDEKLKNAYETLDQVRKEVLGEGWRKAETLVKAVERHYQEALISSNNLPLKVSETLKHLEKKLSDIEKSCGDVLDTTMTNTLSHAEQLNKSVQIALQHAKSRLITYDELPVPWRENPYIIRGYRFCSKYSDCLFGVVKLHNETCNIWSHLVGFMIMLAISLYHYPTTSSWQESSAMDKVTMIVFLVAAMKCLMCSAIWHTFSGISHLHVKQRFACVDYTGITVLITCSILTTEYAAFYCSPVSKFIYMAATMLFGLCGLVLTWKPDFDSPANRGKRILFFVSFAVAGVSGFVHNCFLQGFAQTFWFYLPVFKSLMCYTVGVVVYGLLIPERWCPGGIFDYFGMSHNLWHLSVFGGIYYHYVATVSLLEGAKAYSCSI